MRKLLPLFLTLSLLAVYSGIFAQNEMTDAEMVAEDMGDDPMAFQTPKDMWELTPNFGVMFLGADIPAKIGFGAGLSIRKSTDYLFSLRFDGLWGQLSGETDDDFLQQNGFSRSYKTTWFSGTAFGVFSLNSIRFDRALKKTNLYAMAGGGLNYFDVTESENEVNEAAAGDAEWDPHMAIGAGASFRISRRINIGIEHQVMLAFGNRSDLIDGLSKVRQGWWTPFRDVLNYSNIRIGINLGNFNKRSEPKYWVNPMEVVLDEMDQLREAQAANRITDSDGDGVIDQFDEEPGSDPNAIVDTRGRTLDSDGDGIPDHLDAEPYITPRPDQQIDANGRVIVADRQELTEARVLELIEENRRDVEDDVYLPMVHFNLNSSEIRYADYGTLAGVAQMMRQAPSARLIVLGYTDQTGSTGYNRILSYRRAKAVIDHLVSKHSVARDRLVLQYGGQDDQLVPQNQTYMNRRVEFSLAREGDEEMAPPEGYNE